MQMKRHTKASLLLRGIRHEGILKCSLWHIMVSSSACRLPQVLFRSQVRGLAAQASTERDSPLAFRSEQRSASYRLSFVIEIITVHPGTTRIFIGNFHLDLFALPPTLFF